MQNRKEAFPRVQELASRSLEEIDKALEQFTTETEKVIWELTKYASETTAQLRKTKELLKQETQAALEEVGRTLVASKPLLNSQYGPVFRAMTEEKSDFALFSFKIQVSSIPANALVTLLLDMPSPQQLLANFPLSFKSDLSSRDYFAVIYDDVLKLYDVNSQQSTTHSLAVKFGDGMSYVELTADTLLCVGGHPASSNVYTLDLASVQLTPQPALSLPREAPGVVMVNASAYIFGGRDLSRTELRNCDKFDLAASHCSEIGSMQHSRSWFTPCLYRAVIYLAAASHESSRAVETFRPETEAFTVLPIFLPRGLELGCCSVAFVDYGELCLLTGAKQMLRWRVDSEREFRLTTTARVCWSTRQPRVVEAHVLIAYCGEVIKFSLQAYTFI